MSDRQAPAKSKKPATSTYVIVGIIMVILIVTLVFAIHALTTPLSPQDTIPVQPAYTASTGDATPTDTTTPLPSDAASTTPIAQAAVGTCFEHQATVDSNSKYIDPIDCTQQHDSEVFFADSVADTSYPDSAGWQQDVLNDCHPAFKTYTGITYGQNPWQIYYIYPSQQAWDAGTHLLLCYTTDPLGRVTSVKAAS